MRLWIIVSVIIIIIRASIPSISSMQYIWKSTFKKCARRKSTRPIKMAEEKENYVHRFDIIMFVISVFCITTNFLMICKLFASCLCLPNPQMLPQISITAFILSLGYSPLCQSLNVLFGLNKRGLWPVILKVQPRGQL